MHREGQHPNSHFDARHETGHRRGVWGCVLLSATGGRPPENVARTGQDLHDSPGDGPENAPAGTDLTEVAPEIVVGHVRGLGPGAKHLAYVLMGGHLTAKHYLERAARRRCEVLARDQGYESYRALPETRRGLTRRLAEVDVAASLMWASGMMTGRLVDRYFDVVSVQRKLARDLGLSRILKPANVVTLDEIKARYDGQGAAQ